LDEFGTSSDKNEWNIDELRTAARAETGVRERNVQRFEREVIRKSEKAKWEAIREVTPLFCSDIFGGLNSCYSTQKSC